MEQLPKDFLSLNDWSPETITRALDLADRLKAELRAGTAHRLLEGQSLGMIFSKSSTRTRVSFEVGIAQLGGQGLYLSTADIQLGRGETIPDTARTLGRFLNGIMIRTYAHQDVVELARWSPVPVINGLTDLLHPCQVLADLQTIREEFGRLRGLKLAYVGDGNNVANSLLYGCAKTGVDIRVATPPDYRPDPLVFEQARRIAAEGGSELVWTPDARAAVEGVDVVYTDTWVSMGQEAERAERMKVFLPYQVNRELWTLTGPDAIFLHCLPAYRDMEVTNEIMEGPMSRIFDEAENRLHAQKAVMVLLMGRA
ncbi:MAG: ornithine carbamoyltransferase [Bacillota bacterium]|nr:ornithine carbamoyltransferase [Bacillota bacterium]